MKRKMLLLAVLLLCACALAGCGLTIDAYPDADQYSVGNAELDGQVENLDVSWIDGSVDVEYHDGKTVVISETWDGVRMDAAAMRWHLEEGTLSIRYAASGVQLVNSLNKRLTVQLPRGTVLKKAEVTTVSGNINMGQMFVQEANLKTTSGSIDVFCFSEQLLAKSESGNMRILGAADQYTLSSVSGLITAMPEKCGRLTASTVSGSLRLVRTELNYAILNTTSGTITVSDTRVKETLNVVSVSGVVTMFLPKQPDCTLEVVSLNGRILYGEGIEGLVPGKTFKTVLGDGTAKVRITSTSGNIVICESEN